MYYNKSILLDMDGVICDWITPTAKLFGFSDEQIDNWQRGNYAIENHMKVEERKVWERIDLEGEDFWTNLPETPWARNLYEGCLNIAPTFFLTCPSHNPISLSGKVKWLQKFTNDKRFNRYLIGRPKFLCANNRNVLIDDSERNVKEMIDYGGKAILFPTRYNKLYEQFEKDKDEFYCEILLKTRLIVASLQ